MIVLHSTFSETDKEMKGMAYDELKNEFIGFKWVDVSPAEIGMLYKGDILFSEILENCIIGRNKHTITKPSAADIKSILEKDHVKERLKPYLREELLNNLLNEE